MTLYVWIAAIVIVIYTLLKFFGGTARAGRRGERSIRWRLSWLPDDKYAVINDLLFSNHKGGTTQIDHVVVSPYGIFVIETKNISGKIYGSGIAEKWRSYWKYRDLEFDNPVQQNKAHIEALSKALKNFPDAQFISIIAFTTNAELRVKVSNAYVMYSSQVRRFIRRQKTPVMSTETAREIYKYLLTINITDWKLRRTHVKHVQQSKDKYERRKWEAVQNGICPKCGGKLVLRQGNFGSFYGCSNYPKCKYTYNG